MASWKFLFALAPLAAASVLGAQQPAKALLVYYIYEASGDVVVETSGSLSLGDPDAAPSSCGATGAIVSSGAFICTGSNSSATNGYTLSSGPAFFNGTVDVTGASSVSGVTTVLDGGEEVRFLISNSYSGGPIVSSATFNGTTLAGLGFTTTTGLIGTWTIASGGDQIQVFLGSPPAAVPGPLPLLGAAAAFGYSRRLRRRVNQSRVAPSPAGRISA